MSRKYGSQGLATFDACTFPAVEMPIGVQAKPYRLSLAKARYMAKQEGAVYEVARPGRPGTVSFKVINDVAQPTDRYTQGVFNALRVALNSITSGALAQTGTIDRKVLAAYAEAAAVNDLPEYPSVTQLATVSVKITPQIMMLAGPSPAESDLEGCSSCGLGDEMSDRADRATNTVMAVGAAGIVMTLGLVGIAGYVAYKLLKR